MHQMVETIEADVQSPPSAMEFEMAYQARIAIDRIRFAVKHTEQVGRPSDMTREAGRQLLDALERLGGLDRFHVCSRMTSEDRNRAESSTGNGVAR